MANQPGNYNGLESFSISSDGNTGYSFPAKSIKDSTESLASEDSGRTLDGVMRIYWVRRNIKKVEIVLPPCRIGMINSIQNIVQGKEYYIRYPSFSGTITRHVYTSNMNASMYSGVLYNGLWQDFEFHAIEL